MTLRTRLAAAITLILVGCIFAIPHFRHPVPVAILDDSNSALTLQIKRDVTNDQVEHIPSARALLDPDALTQHSTMVNQHSSVSTTAKTAPPPSSEQWKFPPLERSKPKMTSPAERILAPVAEQRTDFNRPVEPLKPVRLSGQDIGQNATWPISSALPRLATKTAMAPIPQPAKWPIPERAPQTSVTWHRIVNGDSLEIIAQQYYKDPRQAILIYEANRDALLYPTILPIGLELKIPQLASPQRQQPPRLPAVRPLPAQPMSDVRPPDRLAPMAMVSDTEFRTPK